MRKVFFVVLFIFLAAISVLTEQAHASAKRVLLISSYNPAFPTFFQQTNGLESVFKPAGISLDIEFMDSKRFYSPENILAFHNLLKLKLLRLSPYDIIVTSDDNAFKFVLEYQNELFPNIPVVFLGVNNQELARSMNFNDLVTGVIEAVSMHETLGLAFDLFPKANNIYAIVDGSPSGQGDLETFKGHSAHFSGKKLKVLSLGNTSWDEFGRNLEKISDNDAILLLSAYRDKSGTGKLFADSLELIVSHSKAPIFHLWEHGLGQGIIGGRVISQFEQGVAAAKICLDIFNGKQVKDIPVVEGSEVNKFIFDNNILKRFHINKDSLPPGSLVINQPKSLFTQHRKTLLIALCFVILLLSFIGALIVYIFRLRRAEDNARKSEERFALAMDASRDGLWDWNISTDDVYYSPGYKAMLGYKFNEVPSHVDAWVDLIHPADQDAAIEANTDCIENKTDSFEVEFRMQTKSGKWVWILGRGKAVERDETGRAVRVVGTHTDITEHKNIEKELRRLRNYLTNIIDSMPSILIGVDHEGVVTQWNREAQRVTGFSAADAEGKLLSDVFPRLTPQLKWIEESLSSHQIHTDSRVHTQEDGSDKFEDIAIYPLSSNGVEGVVIRVDDVTQRVRLEEMIVQNEKMISIGSLAAGMAHEINNPLGAIVQGTQNLSRRLSLDLPANLKIAEEYNINLEKVYEYLNDRSIFKIIEGINGSGLRAAAIVTNMLSFCRKSDNAVKKNNLAMLLENSLEMAKNEYDLDRKYDFKKIEVEREYAQDLPDICCDGNEIQQVFLNLIKNGAYAVSDKSYVNSSPKLFLRLRLERDTVVAEIEDNGLGMDETARKRAFEPFFTTKPTGSGTGLGLSISYFIIVEQHKGHMEVFSSPGNWTRFIVKLPIKSEC
ncbi:ABC transporter substrate binding protein [Desulfovibrio gilichinskyi]|uniref:histidine kinase n=1 Tax=Desulfovibrio gilichinskyi TaxID=1519643 RepID=A0A1X7D5M0_9BACT|nr:ABC transporter substrate binding protein [Desulfovibrio gilichinskyi]SMF09296.1 PAS domain S-box-containing protein [Desulfovibrio gilichinskyi]